MSAYDRLQQLQEDNKKIYGNSIAFRVPKNACIELPCPTYRTEDKEGYIYVYGYQETTPTATQFQMLNTIKLNIEWSVKRIEFEEGIQVATGELFTIKELYKLFDCEFVKYNLPLIANSKKELQRNISIYAQRMWHERKLHLEIILFVANFLNRKLPKAEQFKQKEVFKKAISAFNYVDRTQPQQLEFKELRRAYINGAKLTNETVKTKQKKMATFMNSFISQCIKPNGKVNISKLEELTSIPRRTIYRLISLYPSNETSQDNSQNHKPEEQRNSTSTIMPIAFGTKVDENPKDGSLNSENVSSSIMPIAFGTKLDEAEQNDRKKIENILIKIYEDRFLGIEEITADKVTLVIDNFDVLKIDNPLRAIETL